MSMLPADAHRRLTPDPAPQRAVEDAFAASGLPSMSTLIVAFARGFRAAEAHHRIVEVPDAR